MNVSDDARGLAFHHHTCSDNRLTVGVNHFTGYFLLRTCECGDSKETAEQQQFRQKFAPPDMGEFASLIFH